MTDWGQPLVSVDVIALRRVGGELQFATHQRQFEPFEGRRALPGVLLLPGETLDGAARRAVAQKLELPDGCITMVAQFGAFDGTNRDPRGATISIGHLALIHEGDGDPHPAAWHRLGGDPLTLPFDHDRIAAAATSEVARRLWTDWPFTRALFGAEFTTSEAIAATHQVGGRLPAPETNLSRWLKASGHVEKVGLRGRDTEWEWESVGA